MTDGQDPMADKPFDPAAVIDAMAPLLGLTVEAGYRPGIVANLDVTVRFARILLIEQIADDVEQAPVFVA